MSSGGEPHVSLWVKSEVFSYGALPIAPHPRLTFNVSYMHLNTHNFYTDSGVDIRVVQYKLEISLLKGDNSSHITL